MGVQLVQMADGSLSLRNDLDALDLIRVGGPSAGGITAAGPAWRGVKVVKIPLIAAAGNGGMLAWQNPEPVDILVTEVLLRIATGAGAGTIDVGAAATGATIADNMIDGLSLVTAGLYDNNQDKGTNGRTRQLVHAAGGATSFITGTAITPTFGSFAGVAYISYLLA